MMIYSSTVSNLPFSLYITERGCRILISFFTYLL